jgi:hypothetical protein
MEKGGMEGRRKPMMMKAQILTKIDGKPTDPAALLAMGDQLGLTDRQIDKLERILASARSKAEQVLTRQQPEELRKLNKTPHAALKMHQMTMEKMKQEMQQMQEKMKR